MSTRSRIAVKISDNEIKSVYCHWDGYPSNNGRLLLNYHNNKAAALQIIILGDLSSLCESLEKPDGHSYDTPKEGFTIAYGRDRGETNTEAINHESVSDLIKAANDSNGEYIYLFDCETNEWKYLITSQAIANLRKGIKAKPIIWYVLTEKNTTEKDD
jgi:hypothetical protein